MVEEISLEELFGVLKEKNKMVVMLSLLGLLISGLYTFFLVTPIYESSSRIVVNQIQNTSQTITNTDIQTNLNLINTYQSIIKEPIILQEALEEISGNLSISDLRSKLNVQTETNSLVFGLSVKDANPYVAADLANAVAQTFERKIGDILEVESVTILSEAIPNLKAVSPNSILNLAMGTIVGLMLGIGIAFLQQFLDKRVKDARIIEELGWTNLGSILEMSTNELKETRMTSNRRIEKKPTLSRRRV